VEWRLTTLKCFAPLLPEKEKYNIQEVFFCVTTLLLLRESFVASNCSGRVLVKMIKMDIEKRPFKMFIAICNPSLKRENKSYGI